MWGNTDWSATKGTGAIFDSSPPTLDGHVISQTRALEHLMFLLCLLFFSSESSEKPKERLVTFRQ